jgi:hypothetical protein
MELSILSGTATPGAIGVVILKGWANAAAARVTASVVMNARAENAEKSLFMVSLWSLGERRL